jgi:thiamine-phosphate diphosphorylase
VHLGVEDPPASSIRAVVPPGFVIGVSVGSEEEAPGAAAGDYVGIGPVFGSASKADAGAAIGVDGFARLARLVPLPAVAIGGVTAENAGVLSGAGASGVAVIRSVLSARDPERAARALRSAIGR